MTFNSSVGFLGNGASCVSRSNQQQHNNNDDEHDNDRIWWHDVVSVVEGGFGGVGNGGVHGLGVGDGRCMSDQGFKSSFGSIAYSTTMNISSDNDNNMTTTDNATRKHDEPRSTPAM